MTEAYRIRDWDANYETHKTRILKSLTWLALPIKLGGEGYAELMDHPNGAAHFGCWIAILEAASQCKPRGTLVKSSGRPYAVPDLARMCRIPAPLMLEALDRLVNIGWVETWRHQDGPAPESGAEAPEEGRHRKTGRPEDRSVDRDTGRNEGAASAPSATAPVAPAPGGSGAPDQGEPEDPSWEVYRDRHGRPWAKPA